MGCLTLNLWTCSCFSSKVPLSSWSLSCNSVFRSHVPKALWVASKAFHCSSACSRLLRASDVRCTFSCQSVVNVSCSRFRVSLPRAEVLGRVSALRESTASSLVSPSFWLEVNSYRWIFKQMSAKHNKAWTMCIILGMHCALYNTFSQSRKYGWEFMPWIVQSSYLLNP